MKSALLVLISLIVSACDCAIEGKRSYGHYVGSHNVLIIDETDYGMSGHDKELLDSSIHSFFLVQEELFGNATSIPYSYTEIHVRDDLIPCRYDGYGCHGCSSVGYLSNGGPFIYLSTVDNCSFDYLLRAQLNKLIPQSLGYDYREYDSLPNMCGVEINDCSLARRRYERYTTFNESCTE